MTLLAGRIARTAAPFAFLALLVSSPLSAQVSQGGFEPPPSAPAGGYDNYSAGATFGSWTVGFGNVDLINGLWQAHGGTYSVDLDGDMHGSIYQDVSTSIGSVYNLSFWMSGNYLGTALKSLDVYWDNSYAGHFQYDITGNGANNMNWQLMQLNGLTADAIGPTTRLEFRSTTDADDCCHGAALDDISLDPVTPDDTTSTPEPASLILMATGLVGVGSVRRRMKAR